jgi:hypothetical protein
MLARPKPKSNNKSVSYWPHYLKEKGGCLTSDTPKLVPCSIPQTEPKTPRWCNLSQTPNCKFLPKTCQMEGFVSHVDAPKLVALQCEFPPIRDKQKSTPPCMPLPGACERGRCDQQGCTWIGANIVISFCPNSKTNLRHAVRYYKRHCGLSVRAKFTRNSKILGCALSSTPSSNLLSYLSNEHIRNPRKALLRLLLLKSRTRLQHPFVWHVSNSRVLKHFHCSFDIAHWHHCKLIDNSLLNTALPGLPLQSPSNFKKKSYGGTACTSNDRGT